MNENGKTENGGSNSVTTALMRVNIPDPVWVEVLPAGAEAKEAVIAKTVAITSVKSPLELETAVAVVKEAKKLLKEVEGYRKELKGPVIALGKKIDGVAEDYVSGILAEVVRVEALVTGWMVAERRRVEEEERKRQQELARLRAEEERKLREAEVAQAKADTVTDPDEVYAAVEAAVDAETDAQRIAEQAREVIVAPSPEAVRVKGMMSKQKLEWEVTDIKALYLAAPHLCKLEPNAAAIRAIITETTKLPGLKVWASDRVIVRA